MVAQRRYKFKVDRLVFSKKGFDSANGGVPSPGMTDGRLVPLPIPEPSRNPRAGVPYAESAVVLPTAEASFMPGVPGAGGFPYLHESLVLTRPGGRWYEWLLPPAFAPQGQLMPFTYRSDPRRWSATEADVSINTGGIGQEYVSTATATSLTGCTPLSAPALRPQPPMPPGFWSNCRTPTRASMVHAAEMSR